MAHYIDADRLRKEVKRLERAAHKSALGCVDSEIRKFHEGKDFAYQHVGILIDSLQQEQTDCHTVEDWIQHIKNADQLTKDVFSKGPYDVLYDALNHPYQHCYDAIKEFGELCFQVGVNVKQEQPEVDLAADIEMEWDSFNKHLVKYEEGSEDVVWLNWNSFNEIARHFYELGLNARKEESK